MEDDNKGAVAVQNSDSVVAVMKALKDLLEYKNNKYGNSALRPVHIFYKGDATDSICVRLDDKLNRLINSNEIRLNDIADVAGYLVLLLISQTVYEGNVPFADKVGGVMNNTYSLVKVLKRPDGNIGVFSKATVDPWLNEADKYIRAILESETLSTVIPLAQNLLNIIVMYMAENGMTDLSQFKD